MSAKFVTLLDKVQKIFKKHKHIYEFIFEKFRLEHT